VSAVPLLTAADALPRRARRVLVAGSSGSGKTTLAAGIANGLDVPYVELDALFHGPDWTPRPSFEDDVRRFAAGPAWVTEWQYDSVRPLLTDRAELSVWLNLPKRVVMWQVVRRTVVRRLRRERLFNGNVEQPLWTFLTDPEHIVRWAWMTHAKEVTAVTTLVRQRPDLAVVRLRSNDEARRWLQGPLRRSAAAGPARGE
jgi:adenylate kinase family enzyme